MVTSFSAARTRSFLLMAIGAIAATPSGRPTSARRRRPCHWHQPSCLSHGTCGRRHGGSRFLDLIDQLRRRTLLARRRGARPGAARCRSRLLEPSSGSSLLRVRSTDPKRQQPNMTSASCAASRRGRCHACADRAPSFHRVLQRRLLTFDTVPSHCGRLQVSSIDV